MTSEPHASARRVFWILDNGSSHAGRSSLDELMASAWPTARLIHLPAQASCLNQIELHFSIVQRRHSPPTTSPPSKRSLSGCWPSAATIAKPFDSTFTGNDPNNVIARIDQHAARLPLAA